MTSADISRGEAMEGRVGRTLEHGGMPAEEVALVIGAHRLAMERRRGVLRDEHHPDFLHPGRVVLILALDTTYRDPTGLAAAALVESERAELRVPRTAVREALGDEVARFGDAVPLTDEGLTEALVLAAHDVRLVALAERLDQCRHAKFWDDAVARRRILEQTETIFGPVADRTDPALARRFDHWAGAFARSLRRGA